MIPLLTQIPQPDLNYQCGYIFTVPSPNKDEFVLVAGYKNGNTCQPMLWRTPAGQAIWIDDNSKCEWQGETVIHGDNWQECLQHVPKKYRPENFRVVDFWGL